MNKPFLADSHAHLDLVNEKDIETILFESKKNKVLEIISNSTSFHSNIKNLELADKYKEINCAIGIYPLDGLELNEKEIENAFTYFKKNIDKAIAIGEVGLEKKYCKTNEEFLKQKEIFIRFIKLSKKYKKPLIVHSRYALREVIETLENNGAKKVMLHSFCESEKLMKRATKNGWFVSVGLIILNDELVQKRIMNIPLEKILLETDMPIKYREKNISSKDILLIAEKISQIKGISLEKVIIQLNDNYLELFKRK